MKPVVLLPQECDKNLREKKKKKKTKKKRKKVRNSEIRYWMRVNEEGAPLVMTWFETEKQTSVSE